MSVLSLEKMEANYWCSVVWSIRHLLPSSCLTLSTVLAEFQVRPCFAAIPTICKIKKKKKQMVKNYKTDTCYKNSSSRPDDALLMSFSVPALRLCRQRQQESLCLPHH